MASMTNASTFSLIDEQWIQVLQDGDYRMVSLKQLFTEARDVDEISGDLPTQDVAVLRFLIAITIRALKLWDEDRWLAAISGELGPAEVLDYLEAHRDRFDLLHPVHPILVSAPGQVQFKGDAKDNAVKIEAKWVQGLRDLVPMMPGGSDKNTLRPFRPDEPIGLDAAVRWILTLGTYGTLGIKSGIEGVNPESKAYGPAPAAGTFAALMHVSGDNLWQTIVRNIVPHMTGPEDLPAWEREHRNTYPHKGSYKKQNPKACRPVAGTCDLYTLRSRVVVLRTAGGLATGARIGTGEYSDFNWGWSDWRDNKKAETRALVLRVDPMTYGRVENKGTKNKPDPQVRIVPASSVKSSLVKQVRVIRDQSSDVRRHRKQIPAITHLLDADIELPLIIPVTLTTASYGTMSATVESVDSQRVDLPLEAFDADTSSAVAQAADLYETAESLLKRLASGAFIAKRAGRSPDGKPSIPGALRKRAESHADGSNLVRSFGHTMSSEFEDWLLDLIEDVDAEEKWQETLTEVLHEHAERIVDTYRVDDLIGGPESVAQCLRQFRSDAKQQGLAKPSMYANPEPAEPTQEDQ